MPYSFPKFGCVGADSISSNTTTDVLELRDGRLLKKAFKGSSVSFSTTITKVGYWGLRGTNQGDGLQTTLSVSGGESITDLVYESITVQEQEETETHERYVGTQQPVEEGGDPAALTYVDAILYMGKTVTVTVNGFGECPFSAADQNKLVTIDTGPAISASEETYTKSFTGYLRNPSTDASNSEFQKFSFELEQFVQDNDATEHAVSLETDEQNVVEDIFTAAGASSVADAKLESTYSRTYNYSADGFLTVELSVEWSPSANDQVTFQTGVPTNLS